MTKRQTSKRQINLSRKLSKLQPLEVFFGLWPFGVCDLPRNARSRLSPAMSLFRHQRIGAGRAPGTCRISIHSGATHAAPVVEHGRAQFPRSLRFVAANEERPV